MCVPEEIENVLFTEEEIEKRVEEIGEELTREYSGKNPLFICVLKGSCVFFADLIRKVRCPVEVEFIRISSYRGTVSGNISVNEDDCPDIRGRDVVIVEDIVDTARTLAKLKEMFLEQNPRSLKIVSFLDKPARRVVNGFSADYTGFSIDDLFVVGYGLDYSQKYRNLPYIGVLNPNKIKVLS